MSGRDRSSANASGKNRYAIPIRPLEGVVSGMNDVLVRARDGRMAAVTVVGGGAAGVELALAMNHRFQRDLFEIRHPRARHHRLRARSRPPCPSGGAREPAARAHAPPRRGSAGRAAVTEVGDGFIRLDNLASSSPPTRSSGPPGPRPTSGSAIPDSRPMTGDSSSPTMPRGAAARPRTPTPGRGRLRQPARPPAAQGGRVRGARGARARRQPARGARRQAAAAVRRRRRKLLPAPISTGERHAVAPGRRAFVGAAGCGAGRTTSDRQFIAEIPRGAQKR